MTGYKFLIDIVFRLQYKMEVGSIHITISNNAIIPDRCKCRTKACFTRSSFTT